MMGTDNTQPPIAPAPDDGSNDHVDPTTIALLADISLTIDAGDALADTSLDEVRRFASDLLEDDPEIEDHWRAPALVDAARHIASCSTCAEAHGAVVVHSSAALCVAGDAGVTVDAARMEQAIAAALEAFEAETPVSHARSLPVAGEAEAAHPSPVKPSRSAWWRTLVGSRPSTSAGGAVGGATGGSGGGLAFLRQRGVVVAAIGLVVIGSAIALRPGRVEQFSTVAIPATTTKPKNDDQAAKAASSAERVELATESAAADTTLPAGFAAGATEETAAAAVAAEAAPPEPAAPLEAAATADASATTGPGTSADASASAAAGAATAEADLSPTTAAAAVQAAPPNEVLNSTAPAQSPRTKAAKKSAPTVEPVAAPTDQSPGQAPAAPATSAAPSESGSAAPVVAAAPATAAPSPAAGTGSPATTTRSAQSAPFDVPPIGDAASPEELLKRFSDAVGRDPSLSAQISGRLTTSTITSAPAQAAAVAAPAPSTPSTPSAAAQAAGAPSSAISCSTTDNVQIVAIGSGSIAGRAVVIRIVRNVSAPSPTPASTFIELLDPVSCNVIARQATP